MVNVNEEPDMRSLQFIGGIHTHSFTDPFPAHTCIPFARKKYIVLLPQNMQISDWIVYKSG